MCLRHSSKGGFGTVLDAIWDAGNINNRCFKFLESTRHDKTQEYSPAAILSFSSIHMFSLFDPWIFLRGPQIFLWCPSIFFFHTNACSLDPSMFCLISECVLFDPQNSFDPWIVTFLILNKYALFDPFTCSFWPQNIFSLGSLPTYFHIGSFYP
jgi:hypothetical protein